MGRSVPIADFFLRRSDRHRKESSHLTDPNNAEAPKRKAANDAEDARPSACVHKSSPSPTRTEVVDDEDEDMPDLVSASDSENDGEDNDDLTFLGARGDKLYWNRGPRPTDFGQLSV